MRRQLVTIVLAALPVASAFAQDPAKSIASTLDVYAFPKDGQSSEQQSKDEAACYDWATSNSGVDPFAAQKQAQETQQQTEQQVAQAQGATRGAGARGAVGGAAAGALIGEIADNDVGNSAGWGAAVGLGWGGPMTNVVSRNNILQVTRQSISDRARCPVNDFDYDLSSAPFVAAASPPVG